MFTTLLVASLCGQFYGPASHVPYNTALGSSYIQSLTGRNNGGGGGWIGRPPARPKVITFRTSLSIMDRPGETGRVVALNEAAHTITVRLPAETVLVRYGPGTIFRSETGEFPEIVPGRIINVDGHTITIVR